jgi:hypothetical protein
LFERYNLRGKIVVIETDRDFFVRGMGTYVQSMIERGRISSLARVWYNTAKYRLAQRLVGLVSSFGVAPRMDMFNRVLYRSMRSGAWDARYFHDASQRIADIQSDPRAICRLDDAYLEQARQAVAELQARGCTVILSGVPSPNAPDAAQVQELALNLNLPCARPDVPGLSVRDGEHLTQESARIYTAAFLINLRKHLCLHTWGH